ncbi:hypothetical protein T5B8_05043 [Salinisphaera sp. T5B8]|uniref:DUF3108 domain-containing protein n=1 Tax=Salinisphaera sp. T5B8 TaxID=1304154 RepID=UPI00333E8E26
MTTTTGWRFHEPRPTRWVALGVLLLALLFSPLAGADVMQPFDAQFKVKRGAVTLGTTRFSLARDGSDNCFVFRGEANPNAIVRVFVGDVNDESRFCIEDGVVRPQHFSHHMQGNTEDSYALDFDWSNHEVTYRSEAGDTKTLSLGEQAFDPLSIQIAARRWVASTADPDNAGERDFELIDEKKHKTYRLRASDGGRIKTPAGRYDTLKIERVDDPKRGLRFWLARNADWIPVQVEHEKPKTGVFRMQLTALER